MTLVAISASYGALGSRIGPALAERLGVPFLDRAIPLEVAERLDVTIDVAESVEEQEESLLERMLRGFVGGDVGVPSPLPAQALSPDELRRATEEVVLRHAATRNAVILGRAAVVVLRDDPAALRVRLHGPPERRRRQAMELQSLDERTADRALRSADRAHAAYVKRFYAARLEDPSLYHLMLDTTVLPVETAIELILLAARSFHAGPTATAPQGAAAPTR